MALRSVVRRTPSGKLKSQDVESVSMDATLEEREAKKRREWERLRALTPSDRLEMAFQMMAFVRELSEGAERARAKA